MFTYINPLPVKKKQKRIIYPRIVKMEISYYFSLDLPVVNGVPDWNGIYTSEPLLLCKNTMHPERIRTFGGAAWKAELLQCAAEEYLKVNKCPIIIYDRKAILKNSVFALARLAKCAAVYTEFPKEYYTIQSKLLNEYGVFLLVNSSAGIKHGASFAPFGTANFPVKKGFKYFSANSITDDDIFIMPELIKSKPPKVAALDFAHALCKRCGIGRAKSYLKALQTAKSS